MFRCTAERFSNKERENQVPENRVNTRRAYKRGTILLTPSMKDQGKYDELFPRQTAWINNNVSPEDFHSRSRLSVFVYLGHVVREHINISIKTSLKRSFFPFMVTVRASTRIHTYTYTSWLFKRSSASKWQVWHRFIHYLLGCRYLPRVWDNGNSNNNINSPRVLS